MTAADWISRALLVGLMAWTLSVAWQTSIAVAVQGDRLTHLEAGCVTVGKLR